MGRADARRRTRRPRRPARTRSAHPARASRVRRARVARPPREVAARALVVLTTLVRCVALVALVADPGDSVLWVVAAAPLGHGLAVVVAALSRSTWKGDDSWQRTGGFAARAIGVEAAVAAVLAAGAALVDPQWDLLAAAVLVPLLGTLGLLLVPSAFVLVVLPVGVLVARVVPALRGEVSAILQICVATLLLGITVFAVGAADVTPGSGRGHLAQGVAIVLGLARPAYDAHPWGLTVARIGGGVLLASLLGLIAVGWWLGARDTAPSEPVETT